MQAAGLKGCAPQKCFVDNIEAWSVNEIAINWNAPLAWVAAYLDEKSAGPDQDRRARSPAATSGLPRGSPLGSPSQIERRGRNPGTSRRRGVPARGDQSPIRERVTWLAKALPVYSPGGNLPRSVSRLAPARACALRDASSSS